MKIFLNFLALATVATVTGSNIYWQWANAWVACLIALLATYAICLTVEKIADKKAARQMRKLYGQDWG